MKTDYSRDLIDPVAHAEQQAWLRAMARRSVQSGSERITKIVPHGNDSRATQTAHPELSNPATDAA